MEPSIKSFYKDKTVFLTGATGYLGSLFLAKLMRLGNVKEVLILSRPKKGKSNQERLSLILSDFLFQETSIYDENFVNKLRIVNGDIAMEHAGISRDDRDYIKSHVEIIIHCAATVRFDEQLRTSIKINVCGTKSMLNIAIETKNLQSFIHVSTAYAQCPRHDIKETFYEPPIEYRRAIKFCEELDDDLIDGVTEKLIAPWPNTYTFTKAIAEDMIRDYSDRLPILIIRPSISN